MKQEKIRVVLYARTSKTDGSQSPDNQLAELRRYARTQKKWIVIHEYVDRMSGASQARPEFQKLMYGATQRSFDLVLFWSLDRLTREGARKTLEYLGTFNQYGLAYRSLKEEFLDTTGGPFKDALVAFMGALAEQERTRLTERVNAGLARARANGVQLGRRPIVSDASRLYAMSKELTLSEISKRTKLSRATISRRIRAYDRRAI